MMAPESSTDEMVFTELVGELDIACEYDRIFRCGPAHAQWEMRAACGCGNTAVRLVCEDCKNAVLQTEDGFSCPSCEEVTIPARHLFWLVNPL